MKAVSQARIHRNDVLAFQSKFRPLVPIRGMEISFVGPSGVRTMSTSI